jgi:glucokinase
MADRAATVLALDLGASRIRTGVVLADGTLFGRRSDQTPRLAEDVVSTALTLARQTMASADMEAHRVLAPDALSIAGPGPLDPYKGEFLDPPNLDRSLWRFPFAARLGEALGLPVSMDRDTVVAALGEGAFGAARGLTDYIYVTVSTGVGGAIVSGGRLLRGADGLAGELGHLTVDINGPRCGCGANGHLEAYVSGTGIINAARAIGRDVEVASLVAAYEDAGEPWAQEIMESARRAFAAAAVALVDVFNPQRIIVGGGLAMGQGDRLLQPARDAIASTAFKRQAAHVEVVPAQLGDDVGLIGAVPLVALARRRATGDDGDLHNDAT